MSKKRRRKRVAVFDYETDPFAYGEAIYPFCAGFYDGITYRYYWGNTGDVIAWVVARIAELPKDYVIYAHNGGKFDFLFMLSYIEDMQLVNGRILKAKIRGREIRDSYAVYPEPLRNYKKGDIEYWKMKADVRDQHRPEILQYLKEDCLYLYELVDGFQDEFGDALTIGGAAMREFRKFHEVKTSNSIWDQRIRKFYYGGRCQVFKSGITKMPTTIYDINGAYQYVMADMYHPIGLAIDIRQRLGKFTAFATIDAINLGALPSRSKEGLTFTERSGIFHATIHEINAGLETGTLKIRKVIEAWDMPERAKFSEFIEHFTKLKNEAENRGDKMLRYFYKRVQNSSYGKQAQNPLEYMVYHITRGTLPDDPQWELKYELADMSIWQKPMHEKLYNWDVKTASWNLKPESERLGREAYATAGYYNVATAASITGATRSLLLRALAKAESPLYCDTDSIICHKLNVECDAQKLGAWKIEAQGDTIAIAGKKMYALSRNGEEVKRASKGVRFGLKEITAVALGETVEYPDPVPKFKLDGRQTFNRPRRIKRTARV